MQEIVDWLNGIIWSNALIYLCLGTGLFFSVLTRFVQVRLFKEMIHLLFSSKESERGISSFQALAVSLSGRVGTGNIAGVAAAIGFGGGFLAGTGVFDDHHGDDVTDRAPLVIDKHAAAAFGPERTRRLRR